MDSSRGQNSNYPWGRDCEGMWGGPVCQGWWGITKKNEMLSVNSGNFWNFSSVFSPHPGPSPLVLWFIRKNFPSSFQAQGSGHSQPRSHLTSYISEDVEGSAKNTSYSEHVFKQGNILYKERQGCWIQQSKEKTILRCLQLTKADPSIRNFHWGMLISLFKEKGVTCS